MFVWDVSPILLTLGPIQVRYYGLLFAIMMIGGYYLWQWQMLRGGHTQKQAEGFFLWGAIAVIGGSRLGQVLFYDPARYLANPIEILYVWRGGLASHGATLGLVLVLYLYARHLKLSKLEVLDRFSMSAALGALMVRIGNFMNSEIIGRITNLPWCVHFVRYLDGGKYCRHPSQLYEASFGLAILVGLVLLERKLGKKRPPALLIGVFLVSYFFCRFLVEFVKEYQILPSGSSLTMGQYLSIPFFLMGVYLLVYAWKHRHDGLPLPSEQKVPTPKIILQRKKGKKKRRRR